MVALPSRLMYFFSDISLISCVFRLSFTFLQSLRCNLHGSKWAHVLIENVIFLFCKHSNTSNVSLKNNLFKKKKANHIHFQSKYISTCCSVLVPSGKSILLRFKYTTFCSVQAATTLNCPPMCLPLILARLCPDVPPSIKATALSGWIHVIKAASWVHFSGWNWQSVVSPKYSC